MKLSRTAEQAPLAMLRRERKILSVLFADIKGSTELVAEQDPEQAADWLESVVNVMREAVHHFGGTVNRAQGDGIMALFGAPVEYEDHAVRACGAALEMLETACQAVDDNISPAFSIRVGISSGEVITLPVMSDSRLHYDAMGSIVHLAARLEQAAAPNTALISGETWTQASCAFEASKREITGMRGFGAALETFKLGRWAKPDASRFPRIILEGLGPFVGREAELATLRTNFASVRDDRGLVTCILGEPGVGKSRLISECIRSIKGDVRLAYSRWSPYKAFSFGPLAELVADIAGLRTEKSPQGRRRRLSAALQGYASDDAQDAEGCSTEVALQMLLDVPPSSSRFNSLPPAERRLKVERTALDYLSKASRQAPLIIVVEDIHWLDEEGLAQVVRICSRLRHERCFMILSARNEAALDPALQTHFDETCHIKPLDALNAAKLIGALLRAGRGTVNLSHELSKRTGGNPLFIEEALRALHQSGALSRDGHHYILQKPGVEIPVPPTIRGLLATRIDRLPDTLKDVLQAVSAMGHSASIESLRQLLGLDTPTLGPIIERLIAAGFLASVAEHNTEPVSHVEFRHPLVREVAYREMLIRDRIIIHRWMLARLEDEHRRGQIARTDLLAEHAMRSEAWEKAGPYMLAAGREAFRRDANSDAVRLLLQGLEAAKQCPEGHDRTTTLLELRLELRNPLFQLGRVDELGAHLALVRPTAVALADSLYTGRYHIFQSHFDWFTGYSKAALVEAQSAQDLAIVHGNEALAVRANFQKGLVAFSQGLNCDAIDAMDGVTSWLEAGGRCDTFGLNKSLLITTLTYSARAHAELGAIPKARAMAARAAAAARDLNNHFAWVFVYVATGWIDFCDGKPGQARSSLERADEICTNQEVPMMTPVVAAYLALALLGAANATPVGKDAFRQRAVQHATRSVAQGSDFHFGAFQPKRHAILSLTLAATGQAERALERAVEALDGARKQNEQNSEAYALFAISIAQRMLGGEWREPAQAAAARASKLGIVSTLAYFGTCIFRDKLGCTA